MQQIQLAAKLKAGKWKSALIVDGAFNDAVIGESLSDIVLDAIAGVLSANYPEGQEVSVTVAVSKPENRPIFPPPGAPNGS